MAEAKARRHDIENELRRIERISDWSGHAGRGVDEKVSAWLLLAIQVAVVIGVGALVVVNWRDLLSLGGASEAVLVAVVLALLWTHLSGRLLKSIHRHFAIRRKLGELERRVSNLSGTDSSGHRRA